MNNVSIKIPLAETTPAEKDAFIQKALKILSELLEKLETTVVITVAEDISSEKKSKKEYRSKTDLLKKLKKLKNERKKKKRKREKAQSRKKSIRKKRERAIKSNCIVNIIDKTLQV